METVCGKSRERDKEVGPNKKLETLSWQDEPCGQSLPEGQLAVIFKPG